MNSRNVEGIVISPNKKDTKQLKTSIMKQNKKSKLLNNSTVSKFVTRKLVDVNYFSGGQYSVNKNIRFKTLMLRKVQFDYNYAYIILKGTIDLLATAANENDKCKKMWCLKITLQSGRPN